MKNKQLVINMFANIFSFIINLGVSFLLTPYLINNVGKEAYSFFPLANNFIGYVNIITVALNSMASRFITIKIHENNNEEANKYFNSVLISNTIIAIIGSIPSMLFIIFIENILNIPKEIVEQVRYLFSFIFIGMILSIITSVFGVATFAKNRLDLSSKRTIESNIIRVICLISLFSIFSPSVVYIGLVNLVVIVYTLIANINYTKKLLPEVDINFKKFDFKAIKELISSGIWNSINQLSVVLLTGLDLLIANIFLGAALSAELSIVKTIPNFIQSLIGMLVSVFVPQFTILYAKKNKEGLVKSVNNSIKFMGLIVTIPIGFLIVFGDIFFELWVPGENSIKLQILSNMTIIPFIISGSINTIFNIFTVTNKLKLPSIILLITGILNTSIVFILIKTTNLSVFAIPLVSGILVILRNIIFTPIYGARCLEERWNIFYRDIFKGIICTITMILICIIVRNNIQINNWTYLILSAIISSVIALLINLLIIFDIEDIKIFINKFIDIIKLKVNF